MRFLSSTALRPEQSRDAGRRGRTEPRKSSPASRRPSCQQRGESSRSQGLSALLPCSRWERGCCEDPGPEGLLRPIFCWWWREEETLLVTPRGPVRQAVEGGRARSLRSGPAYIWFSSVAQLCPTLCDTMNHSMRQTSLSITNSRSLLKLMSIELVMPSSYLLLCRALLLLPPVPPSIMIFSSESTLCMKWPKY